MARLLSALFALVLCACGGATDPAPAPAPAPAQSEAAPVPPETAPPPARAAEVVLGSLDEACDGVPALTGRALAAFIAPAYRPTLRWKNTSPTTRATFELTYHGGAIVCRPRPIAPQDRDLPPSAAPRTCLPPMLRMDVTLHFATDDEVFDVVLPATVRATSYGVTLADVSFEGSFPTEKQLDAVVLPGSASLFGQLDTTGATAGELGQSTGSSEYFVGWWSGH
jgi:hypothetical protein